MGLTMILLPALIGLLVFIYFRLSSSYNYWSKRGIPSMEASLPFGNVKDVIFMRKTMSQLYQEIYLKFSGESVVGFYKITTPILLVRKPSLVRTVLLKEYSSFSANDFHISSDIDPILNMNAFAVRGDKWKQLRMLQVKWLSPAKLKSMFPLISSVCEPLVDYLNRNAMKPLEAKYLGGNFTADSSASVVFGCFSNSFEDPNSKFRVMSNKIINGEFFQNLSMLLGFYAPGLANRLRCRVVQKELADYFTQLLTDIVQKRIAERFTRNDFLQQFVNDNIEAINKGLPPVHSYENIAAHCINFFMDGYNTSSIVLCFTMYELAVNPEWQHRVRNEIKSMVENYTELTYDILLELNNMNMVISETMRLNPVIGTMTRICTKTTSLVDEEGNTFRVEEGTPVAISVYALHMDPQYYPSPEEFKPERFLTPSQDADQRYAYLPFGEGPRICPGMKFGQMVVKACLAAILLNFEILPTKPNQKIEPDTSSSFLNIAKGGVWLKFKPLQK